MRSSTESMQFSRDTIYTSRDTTVKFNNQSLTMGKLSRYVFTLDPLYNRTKKIPTEKSKTIGNNKVVSGWTHGRVGLLQAWIRSGIKRVQSGRGPKYRVETSTVAPHGTKQSRNTKYRHIVDAIPAHHWKRLGKMFGRLAKLAAQLSSGQTKNDLEEVISLFQLLPSQTTVNEILSNSYKISVSPFVFHPFPNV